MSHAKAYPLHCVVQHYDWGKIGCNSEVAQLVKSVCPAVEIDEKKPYAELWIGTHPSGPSAVMTSQRKIGKPLAEMISENPKWLGDKVQQEFGMKLPFLLKVLSVNTALSIQAHPNKGRAKQLHESRPDLYKDPNHKPEMAVALTPFEALCGFRPFKEIVKFLTEIPELKSLVGKSITENMECIQDSNIEEQKKALKECFTAVMTASKADVKNLLASLVENILEMKKNGNDINGLLGDLLLRIHEDFPGDVGCFGIYFLNYLKMEPGEALFLGPDEAHAYLYGDCIEIMACSDNVVRAGLTPKFIDVHELCNMLTYTCAPAHDKLFQGHRHEEGGNCCTVYNPPIPDFTLDKIELSAAATKNYKINAKDSASLLLVIRGQADVDCGGDYGVRCLRQGSVLFIPANECLEITISKPSEDLSIFQAYCQI